MKKEKIDNLEIIEKRIKKLTNRLWAGVFVMLLSVVIMFTFVYYDQIALALSGNYVKSTGDSLLATDWNNLAADFVDKTGDTMTGDLTVNANIVGTTVCDGGGKCLDSIAWGDITGMPADFADGVDGGSTFTIVTTGWDAAPAPDITANCPSGYTLIGGACDWDDSDGAWGDARSRPNGNGWRCNSWDGSRGARAHAFCVQ